MLSITTTDESTTMPKSIAPSESRLAAMPACHMPTKPHIIERGMAVAATSPARRLPSMQYRMTTTRNAPSSRFCRTVAITWSISRVRS